MESQIMISGVITNTELNANVQSIIRPVAAISVFDHEKRKWAENIVLVFSENEDARRFKGLTVGDVILVTGELSYIAEVGYVIYVSKHTILCKNSSNNTAQKNKIMVFEGCNHQNFIFIKGKLIAYNKEKQIATITHAISSNIRGDIVKEATYPVHVLNHVTEEISDCIFIGHFGSTYIEGNLWTVKNS